MIYELPGWVCEKCGIFQGAMKTERQKCRACDEPRPEKQSVTTMGRNILLLCISYLVEELEKTRAAHTAVQTRCTEFLKLEKPLHCFHDGLRNVAGEDHRAVTKWCATCGAIRYGAEPWRLPGGVTREEPPVELPREVPSPEECVCGCVACRQAYHTRCMRKAGGCCLTWEEANIIRSKAGLEPLAYEEYFPAATLASSESPSASPASTQGTAPAPPQGSSPIPTLKP